MSNAENRDVCVRCQDRGILGIQGFCPRCGKIAACGIGNPVQHQGEPVALPARKDMSDLRGGGYWKGIYEGWNACLDEIAKLGALYTHADPAEVESLKADKQAFAQNAVDLRAEVERLRAKLIKINELIFAVGAPLGGHVYFNIRELCAEELRNPSLSGAEPSAPATLCASELGFHAETGTCEAKAIIGRIKDLGITYFRCMPDRFGDCLWFFNCRNVPSVLPEWLVVKSSTAKDWVGSGGMTEEIARKIEEDAGKYRSAPAEADEASACSSCDGSGVDLWRGGRDPWGRASSCTACNGSGKAPDLVGVPRDVIEDIVEDAVNGRVISVDDLDELRAALERKP